EEQGLEREPGGARERGRERERVSAWPGRLEHGRPALAPGRLALRERGPRGGRVRSARQRLAHAVASEDAGDVGERADVEELLRARDHEEDDDARGLA